MKSAAVFATYLALAWAGSEPIWLSGIPSRVVPVTRDIPLTDATDLPVNVAHDLIRTLGYVKPSNYDTAINAGWTTIPATRTANIIPKDPMTSSLCHKKPWLCSVSNRVATDMDVPTSMYKTLPYVPETGWPLYRVLDTSYPIVKSLHAPLRAADNDYVNTVPTYSDPWITSKYWPTSEVRLLKTIPTSVPVVSNPAVALIPTKTIPLVNPSIVSVPTDIVPKGYPTMDTTTTSNLETTVIPHYLKAATVPVLSVAEPTITTNNLIPSVAPTTVI